MISWKALCFCPQLKAEELEAGRHFLCYSAYIFLPKMLQCNTIKNLVLEHLGVSPIFTQYYICLLSLKKSFNCGSLRVKQQNILL